MNKSELINMLKDKAAINKIDSEKVVDTFFEKVKETSILFYYHFLKKLLFQTCRPLPGLLISSTEHMYLIWRSGSLSDSKKQG